MKKLAIIFLIFTICTVAHAQKPKAQNNGGSSNNSSYYERVQVEKIAYFTSTLDLSINEAQNFWPVYNAYCKELETVHNQAVTALKSLKAKNLPKDELEKAINSYCDAISKEGELTSKYTREFKKILPLEKVAKIFSIENDFRIFLLNKLRGNNKHS